MVIAIGGAIVSVTGFLGFDNIISTGGGAIVVGNRCTAPWAAPIIVDAGFNGNIRALKIAG